MSLVHRFNDSLTYSHAAADMPEWEAVYRKAFPTFSAMIDHRHDGEHQRAGIDRSVILQNSKQILIDEKVRKKDFGDIALEYVSNDRRGDKGWVCKCIRADYIAYMIVPRRMCYMLPVVQLQTAWKANEQGWINEYGTIRAANDGYSTLSCCVPVAKLFAAIGNALRIAF